MASSDSTGQTPDSLDTSSTDSGTPDFFTSITGNVVTLAGAFGVLQRSNNSPVQNTIPSNTPSTVPTAPAPKPAFYAGWTTQKKIVVGILSGVGLIALLKGLQILFSKKGG